MLYKEREIDELDTYIDHVNAMTTEKLHGKSAIAAELAFRDSRIKELEQELLVNQVAISEVGDMNVTISGFIENLDYNIDGRDSAFNLSLEISSKIQGLNLPEFSY